MPEGDTVYRTARRLHAALAEQPLVTADLRWGETEGSHLVGRRTLEVVSRGKHLLHRIEGGHTVHSHLRMEGSWRIARTGSSDATKGLRRADLRAGFATSEWTAMGLRLGMLDLLPTQGEDQVVGHLGPDVLGTDWDPEQVVASLQDRGARDADLTVVTALLDQRILAGVGTFWASEMLFVEKEQPWRPVAAIDPGRLRQLVDKVAAMIDRGKDNAVQSSTGILRLGQQQFVHGRSGQPCRRCGEGVRVAMAGKPPQDRTIFYCPTCQGGLGPTDDGRRQTPLGSQRTPGRSRGRYDRSRGR